MTKAEQDLEEATKRIKQYCCENLQLCSKTMEYAAKANIDTSGAIAGDQNEIILPPAKASKPRI